MPFSASKISSVRAADSYVRRQNAFSRTAVSSRQMLSICAWVRALVVSTAFLGRTRPTLGSPVTHPRVRHQVMAERSADRCRAQVAGAAVSKASPAGPSCGTVQEVSEPCAHAMPDFGKRLRSIGSVVRRENASGLAQ